MVATSTEKQLSMGITIHNKLSPAKVTEVYDTYWRFAAKRQEIFYNRINGKEFPWSTDPILNKHRFTNAYRAADRVSQYLIRNVMYNDALPSDPTEVLFRILMCKLFNKIETWEVLGAKLGIVSYDTYKFGDYDFVLSNAINSGKRIYSAAYIMPSGKSFFGYERKHSNHLKLIELIIKEETHHKLTSAKTMQQAFEILKKFPGLGDFLAYQLLIDINYSNIINFSESEFVVPGPGAKGGISKCFSDMGGLSEKEIIKLVTDRQELECNRLGIDFRNLWGRRLHLIDCQNLFCEVDKYARIKHPDIKGASDRTRIKQLYKENNHPINYWFPPKWGINHSISESIVPRKGVIQKLF